MANLKAKYRIDFPFGYAEEAEERLRKIKKFLSQINSDPDSISKEISEFLSIEIRGAACVAASGELERYFREVLKFLYKEIKDNSLLHKDLQPGLRVVGCSSNFQLLSSQKLGIKNWSNRYDLISSNALSHAFDYAPSSSSPVQPLDGKTIKKEHISIINQALNLDYHVPGKYMNSITAISSIRNDVAHVNYPIEEVFHEANMEKSIDVIIGHLDNIIEFILEVSYEINDYYYNKKYLVSALG